METQKTVTKAAPQPPATRDEWLLAYYPLDDVWPMDPDGARVLAETAAWLRDRCRSGLRRLLHRRAA